jgi:Zn-dependent metalloprotease
MVLVMGDVFVKLTTGIAFGAVLAVAAATGQGVTAYGATARSLTLTKTQGVEAEQSASALAGQALGLGAGEQLVVKDVINDTDGSTHVRYNRTFNGLRVIGGDLVSHRDKTGQVKSVNWNFGQKMEVASMTPKVALASATAAGATTASLARETTAASKGDLVVYADGATPKLAYDVLTQGVKADQTPSRLHTIVDADTGATLSTWDEIETGTGHGIFVGAVPLGTTAGLTAAGGFSMRDPAGNSTTDLQGSASDTATGTTFTDKDDIWGNGLAADRASAAVDAQYGAEKTFQYYKTIQGRNGIWNTGVGARSRVHFGNAYENAYWDGTQMTYGDGAGNTHPLVALDVAGHEMTHGVTENTAGLVYSGDAGGLNEATSDIFGTAVEWYANLPSERPNYLIGEKLNLFGNGTPIRYMDKPSKDGASKDCWSSSLKSLDPHLSSGPLNHWFYLASEGSGAKVVNGVAYNSPTCNASTVTPIGRDVAAKIWYRTLTTYLTSKSTYKSAREGAIKSAKDLYGVASPQCKGIAASFSAIAVPAGAATC